MGWAMAEEFITEAFMESSLCCRALQHSGLLDHPALHIPNEGRVDLSPSSGSSLSDAAEAALGMEAPCSQPVGWPDHVSHDSVHLRVSTVASAFCGQRDVMCLLRS